MISALIYNNLIISWMVLVTLAVFLVSILIQFGFHTYLNLKIRKQACKSDEVDKTNLPVSIIIAARNEENNLKTNLPKILQQNYPDFEVIVVNDCSEDNTLEIAESFKKIHSNFKVINLINHVGKKQALTVGIRESKYEHLLFIDADCYPSSDMWISSMVSKFSTQKEIIVGYGAYESTGGFINGFINYDTYLIALQYMVSIVFGKPYMCVGRNLAYTKSVWLKNDGFESHKEILSGDDDLFISQVANDNNTTICLSPESFTISTPAKSVIAYVKQKSRHISTSSKYTFFAKVFTSIDVISKTFIFLSAFILLFTPFWSTIVTILTLRLLYLYFVGTNSRKLFNTKIAFHYFILFDIFALVFYLMVIVANRFIYKIKTW